MKIRELKVCELSQLTIEKFYGAIVGGIVSFPVRLDKSRNIGVSVDRRTPTRLFLDYFPALRTSLVERRPMRQFSCLPMALSAALFRMTN